MTTVRFASLVAVLLLLSGCEVATSTSDAASTGSTTGSQGSSGSASVSPAPTPADTAPPSAPTAAPPASPPPSAPTAAPAAGGVARPDPRLTPGEVFAATTVPQICTPGYASSVRHVEPAQYVEVYGAYGIPYPEPSGTYELDHLIPLELGGDNANANLWPEPASPPPGYHQKDQLENTMHGLVCSGRLELVEAQHEIASDWYAAYQRYVGG